MVRGQVRTWSEVRLGYLVRSQGLSLDLINPQIQDSHRTGCSGWGNVWSTQMVTWSRCVT